ncbi:MAG: EamA family transporter [Candidatus Latescibacteria bacterium]|jgi:drug/metabolite transporter (DMT)-like permease|nr:EamA family transporter [Candidatus Latescibacterota bacterium]
MTALALNIVLSVAFFHVIRAAQVRGSNMMVVGAVNYVLASSLCFGISIAEGNTALSPPTLFWGVVQGLAFVCSFFLICASMNLTGMAIATAILRLSVVIPVLASILYWGEVPSTYQVLGILACLASLPLIGTRARNVGKSAGLGWRELWILGLLFLGPGVARVASKGFVEAQVPDARTTFMGVLYGVAALGVLATFLSPRRRRSLSGGWDGVKMGIVNVSSIITMLVALEQVRGVVVFPVQTSAGLVLNSLFAALVWHERLTRKTWIGMGVAAFGLAFVNLD